MLKRVFDIFFSFLGIVLLSPLFFIVALLVIIESGLPVFYSQKKKKKNNVEFSLFKFRTMIKDADKNGLLTVGGRDARITKVGYYLRKTKVDELPQLINVLIGDMSLVGPRPEVKKYTDLYTEKQQQVLTVKPGITDYASIQFVDENDLLGKSENPEETYINEIMPKKLELNLKYVQQSSLLTDTTIIFKTIAKIIFR